MRKVVSFTRFDERTPEDSEIIMRAFEHTKAALADRILDEMKRLDAVVNGFQVSVFQHSLQTATRAHRDGAGEETVAVALLHDIGEALAPTNHAAFAANVVGPYVSEDLEWLLRHHAIFQGYYYLHHYGRDRNARDRYRDHPMFAATAEFCARWDQTSFDPRYESLPLDFFEPLVRDLFARAPRGFI
jgi:predicted HD phosphohydrolase